MNFHAFVFGDSLIVNTYYLFPTSDKLRDQEVEIIVEIPQGGMVRINDRLVTLDGSEESDADERIEQSGYLRSDGRYRHYD